MQDDYSFSPEELRTGIRSKFAARYKEGVKPIPISNKPLAAGEAELSVDEQPNPEPDTLAVLEKLSGTADARRARSLPLRYAKRADTA